MSTLETIPFPKGGDYETVIVSSTNGLGELGRGGRSH